MNDHGRPERLSELLQRPYRKVIRGNTEDGFLAEVPELPGLFTAGRTEVEAIALLQDAMAGWFESALAHGDPIPEPDPGPVGGYSGRILLRMPKTLHRRLAERANEEGVSLNQLAVSALSRGIG